MHIAKNSEPASWIPPRLHPFAQDVGSIIPEGFTAYARVFHPPYRRTSDGKEIPVRWRDIAAANNRTIAAEMQRMDISAEPTRFSPSGEELWEQQPRAGSIPREIAVRLAAILASHTRTPELCWFAVWEGWGDLRIRDNGRASVQMYDAASVQMYDAATPPVTRMAPPTPNPAARFSIPGRDLFLLQGAVDDVLKTLSEVDWIYRSPNLWWPDDRAWCVATEIDFNWSYVGGSSACIEQVLTDAELEALPTKPEQGNSMEK
jgi:hypothetical protein